MSRITDLLAPTVLFAFGVAVFIAAVFATQWYFVLRPQRRSRDRGLLREPGRALRRRLDAVDIRLAGAAVGLPLTLFLWHLVYVRALAAADSGFALAALVLAGVAALGWFAGEILRLWPEHLALRQAIDAQAVTAQSLNLLMRQDYWVFHDVHIGDHRINHLVIGPRGVFCVDTKWRRPQRRWTWRGPQPRPKAQVAFDGRRLHFPGWQEWESLEDVEFQTDWLGGWLAQVSGEPESSIPTFGAVALPGWRVASTDWKRLIVFNPATPNMLVQGAGSAARLDATVAHQLVKQLQQHCREHADSRVRRHGEPWWKRLWQRWRGAPAARAAG